MIIASTILTKKLRLRVDSAVRTPCDNAFCKMRGNNCRFDLHGSSAKLQLGFVRPTAKSGGQCRAPCRNYGPLILLCILGKRSGCCECCNVKKSTYTNIEQSDVDNTTRSRLRSQVTFAFQGYTERDGGLSQRGLQTAKYSFPRRQSPNLSSPIIPVSPQHPQAR